MSLAAILKRLDAIEARLNVGRGVGQWVRGLGGEVVWDSYDPDDITPDEARAPLESLTRQMELTAERLRAEPRWRELTAEESARAQRGLEECMECIRAERQAIRDFSDAHQALLDGRAAWPPAASRARLLIVAGLQLFNRNRRRSIIRYGAGLNVSQALRARDLLGTVRREVLPRLCHVQQHGSLFGRSRAPRHRATLVGVVAVILDFLH